MKPWIGGVITRTIRRERSILRSGTDFSRAAENEGVPARQILCGTIPLTKVSKKPTTRCPARQLFLVLSNHATWRL